MKNRLPALDPRNLLVFLLIGLAGCSAFPFQGVLPGQTPTVTPTHPAVATQTLTPTGTSTPARPGSLRIWLPPQFDPNGSSPSAFLLRSRLNEFSSRRSGVHIEVRVKAVNGSGGLLDSLSAANAAAPLALPDLILLPRAILEAAALKGLLFPFDGQIDSLSSDDWYGFAQQLARLQNSTFGLPFAGDALILLYRPATIPEPPLDWTATLALDSPLIFPAGDERALFTLLQYLSADGKIQDNEGLPMLDEKTLTDVLTFYQQAEQAGVMPVWLTQFSSDDQAWKAYGEGRANLIVTWASRYLNELPADTAAVPVPTATGTPLTLADGWVWALSNPQTDNRALTVELAQFLTDSDFLARWTSTAGYLPPRASALAGWSSPALQSLVDQIVHSAQIIPSADVLIALSPALGEATLNVLKEQADPAEAAQSAVARLSGP